MRNRLLALLSVLSLLMTASGQERRGSAWPPDASGLLSDREISARLLAECRRLMEKGGTPKMSDLNAQLQRRSCRILLTPESTRVLKPEDIAATRIDSVLVLGGLYECASCERWHVSIGGGYVIHESGVVVTCYHVVESTNTVVLAAMTRRGQVYPVREVLAASERDDVAIVQIDGNGLTPLSISTNASVGSPVFVISHPDRNFYTFTSGLVSRYARRRRGGSGLVMSITADFAQGSSGGPVFNEAGAVVGTVMSTRSVYSGDEDGEHEDLQMVLKQCAPSHALLSLIQP